jgi:thiamine pyrophosphate-dependent acetolactate synthase large subunit-like protein
MTETLTGAQIAIRLLERQGIRIVTGYPGAPSCRSTMRSGNRPSSVMC